MYLLKMLAIQLHIHTFYSFNIISNLLTLSAELYPLHSDVMENILNILLSYPNNIFFLLLRIFVWPLACLFEKIGKYVYTRPVRPILTAGEAFSSC